MDPFHSTCCLSTLHSHSAFPPLNASHLYNEYMPFLLMATQNIDLWMMINPQWCLRVPTVFTGDSAAPYRNMLHHTDYLRVQIYSDTSLKFLSGFRLTATFENVGQNKALKFNKLQRFFICMNTSGTDWPGLSLQHCKGFFSFFFLESMGALLDPFLNLLSIYFH